AAYISREACAAAAPQTVQPTDTTTGGSGTGGSGSNGQVLGIRATCHDRIAPVTKIGKKSRFTRKGLTLRGTASDKGCGPKGRGKVAHVSLAVSRRIGRNCQWLAP